MGSTRVRQPGSIRTSVALQREQTAGRIGFGFAELLICMATPSSSSSTHDQALVGFV